MERQGSTAAGTRPPDRSNTHANGQRIREIDRVLPRQELGGSRSPRSPWPFFALFFAGLLRSCARERPTSSLSLNRPRASRRTYRLSVPVLISSRPRCFVTITTSPPGDPAMRAPRRAAVTSRISQVAIAVLLAVAAAACSSESANPTMPSGPSFVGTWVGTVKPAAVAGNLQLTLEALPVSVSTGAAQYSGRWTITFPDSRDNTSGLASGRAFAALLTLTLQPSAPGACTMAFSGTLNAAGSRIDGSMSPMSCAGGASTSITLSKQ